MNTPTPRRYLVGAVLLLSYAAFSITWMALSPLSKELMAFFQVDNAKFALLGTVVTISKIAAPLLAGALAMRIGVANTILLGSLSVAAAVLGPLFPTFDVFLATRAVYGIGGAVLLSLIPAILMEWFPKRELPFVNGLNGVMANTGFAVAMFLTPLLASQPAMAISVPGLAEPLRPWQGTLVAFSFLSVLLCIAWALVGRDRPPGAAASAGATASAATKRPPAGRDGEPGYRDVWRMKETWLISLAFSGPVSLYLTLATWLPKFYQDQLGYTKTEAANATSLILFAGIPSAVVSGWLTERLGVRRPFLIVGGALGGTLAFGTFLPSSPTLIAACCVLLGASLFIPKAALLTLTMELPGVSPRHVALISSTMVSVSYVVNSFIPWMVGKVADATGSFVPGFVALSLFSYVVVLCGWLLPETGPRAKVPAQAAELSSAAPARS